MTELHPSICATRRTNVFVQAADERGALAVFSREQSADVRGHVVVVPAEDVAPSGKKHKRRCTDAAWRKANAGNGFGRGRERVQGLSCLRVPHAHPPTKTARNKKARPSWMVSNAPRCAWMTREPLSQGLDPTAGSGVPKDANGVVAVRSRKLGAVSATMNGDGG
jgi:hypothetical protein